MGFHQDRNFIASAAIATEHLYCAQNTHSDDQNQSSDGYHASSLILGMAFMALNYLEVELAPLHILIWIKIHKQYSNAFGAQLKQTSQ